MDIHYAIGDVHGRDDLLEAMHERIAADHRVRRGDERGVIVYVGDYIDRGASSREVIDRVRRGVPGFESVCLKGNHEDLMLACLETDAPHVWSMWLGNGGYETTRSFGLSVDAGDYDPVALARALGSARLQWLDTLKLYHRAGDYLFVHAGIVPGRRLEEQEEKELKPNRINVDTGATFRGELSAVVLGEESGPRFMTVSGKPGRGPEPRR